MNCYLCGEELTDEEDRCFYCEGKGCEICEETGHRKGGCVLCEECEERLEDDPL